MNSSKTLKRFKLNTTAKYSITRPYEAEQIAKYIVKKLFEISNKDSLNSVITDGTAGVGGDSISFSNYFLRVNSVEIDNDTFDLLKKNIREFQRTNIDVFNGDFLKIYKSLKNDVIYLDVPWGGINYRGYEILDLYLSSKKIDECIKEIFDHYKNGSNVLIFLKVPLNFKYTFKIIDKISIYNKSGNISFDVLCLKS